MLCTQVPLVYGRLQRWFRRHYAPRPSSRFSQFIDWGLIRSPHFIWRILMTNIKGHRNMINWPFGNSKVELLKLPKCQYQIFAELPSGFNKLISVAVDLKEIYLNSLNFSLCVFHLKVFFTFSIWNPNLYPFHCHALKFRHFICHKLSEFSSSIIGILRWFTFQCV